MKVLHVLSRLNHSGMERMLECSREHWEAVGVDPVVVGMSDEPHPFAHVLEARGYCVLRVPHVRSIRGLIALRGVLEKTRPEIVHIHQESCLDAVALLSASTPGVEGIVQTVHSCFRFGGTLRIRRKARTAFSRYLGAVWVACGEEVARTERLVFGNRATVVENWVDVDAIAASSTPQARQCARDELGIPPDADVLGLIGNCGDPKNHELIGHALKHVRRPVHLIHVGDPTDMPPIEHASWLDVPQLHDVHSLGARHDVPKILAACDLVLVPSRYEGLPLVPIEALCARLPVLAADVLTLRWLSSFPAVELVRLEPRLWAAAIEQALVRNWDSAVDESAKAVRSRFHASRGVGEYAVIYNAILGRAHHRPGSVARTNRNSFSPSRRDQLPDQGAS